MKAFKHIFSLSVLVALYSVLFLFLLTTKTLNAQTFPVTSVVQVTQFSPYIESYDDPGKVILTLLSTDERPEYEILLRFTLSGPGFSIRTREDYLPFPIVLRRNMPLVLTGTQLRDYFDPVNLLFGGQTMETFQANGGLLPEGPLSLCVEVFDYNRFFDPPVSNNGCANGFMLLQRPPVLLNPIGEIDLPFPQQLRFQWQPQHAGAVVRYTMEVYEHTLPGMADNLIIESTQPLMEVNTVMPFYLMTNLDPLLQNDTRYLVRIRAEDIMGQSAFLNDGWSDVYRFYSYGNVTEEAVDTSSCGFPLLVVSSPINHQNLLVSWNDIPQSAGFILTWKEINVDSIPPTNDPRENNQQPQNRDQGQTNINSLTIPAGRTDVEVDDLEIGQLYAFELCKICPFGTQECSTWTTTFEGLENECITTLDFIRIDSTETSLKLAWTYDPQNVSIDGSFDLIWQLSDATLPADTGTFDLRTN